MRNDPCYIQKLIFSKNRPGQESSDDRRTVFLKQKKKNSFVWTTQSTRESRKLKQAYTYESLDLQSHVVVAMSNHLCKLKSCLWYYLQGKQATTYER